MRLPSHDVAGLMLHAGLPAVFTPAAEPAWPGIAAPLQNGHVLPAEATASGLPNGGGAPAFDSPDAASAADSTVKSRGAVLIASAPAAVEGAAADAGGSRCFWRSIETPRVTAEVRPKG